MRASWAQRSSAAAAGRRPTEISAIRSAVEEERKPRARLDFEERELVVSLGEEQAETGLARALREGEWVVSIQLDPPLGGNIGGLVELSQALKDSGKVGFVDVNDNAGARAGMNAIMFSAAIERATGIETIPHLTTRDYTIMGLEAMLFGAHAEGVRNVLAVTGDPPEVGDYPGSSGIFEIDAIGLTRLMSQLNRGEDFNGRPIDAPTSFYIGVAVNPTADDLDLELERYRQKVEAGAHYAMTQLVFDLDHLDRFFDRFGGPSPIPVLVGICPIWSYRFALRLHNELPGIVVPEELQERLARRGVERGRGRDGGREGAVRGRQGARGRRVPSGSLPPAAQHPEPDRVALRPTRPRARARRPSAGLPCRSTKKLSGSATSSKPRRRSRLAMPFAADPVRNAGLSKRVSNAAARLCPCGRSSSQSRTPGPSVPPWSTAALRLRSPGIPCTWVGAPDDQQVDLVQVDRVAGGEHLRIERPRRWPPRSRACCRTTTRRSLSLSSLPPFTASTPRARRRRHPRKRGSGLSVRTGRSTPRRRACLSACRTTSAGMP